MSIHEYLNDDDMQTLQLQHPYLYFNPNNGGGFYMTDRFMWLGGPVGKGWTPLLRKLSKRIEEHIVETYVKAQGPNVQACIDGKEEPSWPRVVQIKEKFGGLRFYMTDYDDEIQSMIDEAEEEASRTCEFCGEPGEISGPGWFKCKCEKHKKNSM